MPELPEVENILIAHKQLIGLTINNVDVFYSKIVSPNNFDLLCKNQKILDLKRYGKVLFVILNDYFFTVSFRMEGRFYYTNLQLVDKHIHVKISFNNGYYLYYKDTRKFGRLVLYKISELNNIISSIKEEIFDIGIETLSKRLENKNKPIKSLLLDQQIVSGIGNIYADEILYASKINPNKLGGLISIEEVELIIKNATTILKDSINNGGSTIKSFESGHNQKGSYQDKLKVYGKEGCVCKICLNKFIKTRINGRGTTYCPYCQKETKLIGITGNQGSGKSYVLNHIKSLGFSTIDTDLIVSSLYERDYIKELLIKEFNLNSSDNIKNQIKELLVKSPINLKRLNLLLHPYVFKELRSIIYISKKELLFIEMPLLFETKFNKLVNKVIIVSVENNLRLERLKIRNSSISNYLDKFQLDKELLLDKANYVIKSNSGDEIKKELEVIIDECKCI
jgi:formamidopyrimidine-DNA glycosylase